MLINNFFFYNTTDFSDTLHHTDLNMSSRNTLRSTAPYPFQCTGLSLLAYPNQWPCVCHTRCLSSRRSRTQSKNPCPTQSTSRTPCTLRRKSQCPSTDRTPCPCTRSSTSTTNPSGPNGSAAGKNRTYTRHTI